jgi:hypothetical protein
MVSDASAGTFNAKQTGQSQRGGYAVNLIIALLLVLLLIGALPTWPYSSAWGYYPSGGVGLLLIILIIVLLTRGRP